MTDIMDPPKQRHELRVMTPQDGDAKTTWDPDNADEVAAARSMFDKMRRAGHAAYSVKRGGKKDSVITEFDPEIGAIIMAPPIAGG